MAGISISEWLTPSRGIFIKRRCETELCIMLCIALCIRILIGTLSMIRIHVAWIAVSIGRFGVLNALYAKKVIITLKLLGCFPAM